MTTIGLPEIFIFIVVVLLIYKPLRPLIARFRR